jgi:prophage regulatory protein
MLVMLDLYSMSANPDPKTILRIEVVLLRTGLKRTMLYDLIAKEQFPRQVSLGARAVGWYEEKVENWIRSRHGAQRELADGALNSGKTTSAAKTPSHGIPNPTTLNRIPLQRSGNKAIAPSIVGGSGARRRSVPPTIKTSGGAPAAMNESDELKLLRDENTKLKQLVGELALKNSMLQSSAGLMSRSE